MQSLHRMLLERESQGKPIKVLVVGAGQMGTDLIVQIRQMKGIALAGIAVRRNFDQVFDALKYAGYDEIDWVEARNQRYLSYAYRTKKIAVSDDIDLLLTDDSIDVVIDATGHPNSGAEIASKTIKARKHIVMLNVETDVTVGRHLHQLARKSGVIYTGAAGDEPAAAAELVTFARTLGLSVLAAGKGKNNAFNTQATPADLEASAASRNMNPRILTEFVDGTKTMVEMVALANATGLRIDTSGMHGPAADLQELCEVFRTKEEGGILNQEGVADFTVGKGVAPGVFCVVRPRHERVRERFSDLHVGKGPCYTLHRPYHLTSIETPLSAAKAVLLGVQDLAPLDYPVAEVSALAKRDLHPGDLLGRIGECDYRGWAMEWNKFCESHALPLGLAERSIVIEPIRKGELLTYFNCGPDNALKIVELRKEQDAFTRAALSADSISHDTAIRVPLCGDGVV